MVRYQPQDEPPASSMLDLALAYVGAGYSVHPLKPNGKEPLTRHGFKDATRDPEQIRRWWTARPDANIGISCGPSGIIVADLDVKNGGTGPANWAGLVADVEHEPGFACVTPTGGTHLIWRGTGVASSNGQVAESVDIKAEGGYIVAPGSSIGGQQYRTATGESLPRIEELPVASEALRAAATSRGAREREAPQGTVTPGGNRTTLGDLLGNPPERGDGRTNDWLRDVAGHYAYLHRGHYDAYIRACKSAMELVDVDYEDFGKTTRSVWKADLRNHSEALVAASHEADVAKAVERMLVQYEARRAFNHRLGELDPAEPFDAGPLANYLGEADATRYRAEGLILLGGSTIVSAKRKTGKTTFVVNLAHSLLTGEPFLESFKVEPVGGRVAVLNYEVTGGQFAHWATRADVPGDRMILVNLRGRRNPLAHTADRQALAEYLREQQVEFLIVDPFSRAFTGANQNDVSEVGTFLTDLDLFTRSEVGATDLLLTVHTGWNGERSRGSSGLEDWPDSIIRLTTREDDETGPRFLSAMGRDVEVAEDQLELDPATSRLRLTGSGSRKSAAQTGRVSALAGPILQLVGQHPGVKSRELQGLLREAGASFRKGDDSRALQALVDSGEVIRRAVRNAQLHYLPQDAPQPLEGGSF
ncbi:bifunctional DNA primase/polymerase [Homoserinibacter sp. GY 40078]|uniref:bifunctional DNA primase/polymerase n=1 Tax=Homoserinibacter sp. GY 40078 TaxID=2603275 RepID=UPI0011C77EF9|nr:bifunctional DNA primase/polymerase [Homoserinibacter sp. GY 40078]TXK18446.1 AAA family ATPase [Homoserinibacter sp. GY 40078]